MTTPPAIDISELHEFLRTQVPGSLIRIEDARNFTLVVNEEISNQIIDNLVKIFATRHGLTLDEDGSTTPLSYTTDPINKKSDLLAILFTNLSQGRFDGNRQIAVTTRGFVKKST